VNRSELDPAHTGLVVFDALEGYRDRIQRAGALEPLQRITQLCRSAGVAVFLARADHRQDGADLNRVITDTDSSFRPWAADEQQPVRPALTSDEMRLLPELGPQPGDYDVPKHRWSAFFGTHLELSLRARDIDTILLVGGSTHVGIAATAFAARDMDFHVVVVSDGCFGFADQKHYFLAKVFPRMARVRTVEEVSRMLQTAVSGGP
jgi:nicotinamidase-related amidase